MRILHVSDLHVRGTSLNEAWTFPSQLLTRHRPFDIIVVSGDLTDAARPDEYTELLAFTNDTLLGLLASKDRRRIVFVPGNHDVSWCPTINERIFSDAETSAPEDRPTAEDKRSWCKRIEETEWRRHEHEDRISWFRLRRDQYNDRLGPVARFFTDFYGTSLGPDSPDGSRPFNFTRPHEDWSAHVFPERDGHGFGFFGFNSCHRNDKYYVGAHIDLESIASAQRHVARLRQRHPHMIFAAVWHHGLASDRFRPDYLEVGHVNRLQAAGFWLGFHGHTHSAELKLVDPFTTNFPVVATGSLSAPSDDRPGAVGNQLSIVQMGSRDVRVAIHTRSGDGRGFSDRADEHFFFLRDPHRPGRQTPPRHVHKLHERWQIDPDGIAHVERRCDGIEGASPFLVGGFPNRLDHGVHFDTVAWVDGEPVQVASSDPADDGITQWMVTPPAAAGAAGFTCLWRYRTSNAIALGQGDLARQPPPSADFPRPCDPRFRHYDFIARTMKHMFMEYELDLEFDASLGVEIEDAELLVKNVVSGGKPIIRGDRLAVTATLREPELGGRYTLAVKTRATAGNPFEVALTADQRRCALQVLRLCRTSDSTAASPAVRLRDFFETHLGQHVLGADQVLGAGSSWAVYLWAEGADTDGASPRRRLYPAFGTIAPQGWMANFVSGQDLAGHSFRFGRWTAFVRGEAARRSAIYMDRLPHHEHYLESNEPGRFEWIVHVPLLVRPDGPPIGLVGIAGRDATTPIEQLLRNFASNAADQKHTHGPQNDRWELRRLDELQRLHFALHCLFWGALSVLPGLDEPSQEVAKEAFAALTS